MWEVIDSADTVQYRGTEFASALAVMQRDETGKSVLSFYPIPAGY